MNFVGSKIYVHSTKIGLVESCSSPSIYIQKVKRGNKREPVCQKHVTPDVWGYDYLNECIPVLNTYP